MHFKRLVATLSSCIGLLAATQASAAITQWSIDDATFSDGSSMQGSFSYDGSNILDWDITTFRRPGAVGFPEVMGYHYTSSTSALASDPWSFLFSRNNTPAGNVLQLSFAGSLANPGTLIGQALERTESFGGSINTHVIYGFRAVGVAAPVPEPETLLMLGVGLAAIGWRVRQRRTALSSQ